MKQFVIIGNSAAGIAAVEEIREKDKESKIIVVSDEDYPSYCRCLISYYLAKEVSEDKLLYRGEEFYRQNHIELFLNKKVERVDPKKNRIICNDKSQMQYDNLLIATGARPKFPQGIKGIEKKNIFGLRTIKDAKEMEPFVPITHTACVLGGGLIGLKAAYALRKRNIEVKVIIKSKQVLSQMLDAEAASLVHKRLEENGIQILLGTDAQEIIGNGDIKAIKLDSGKAIGCSLIVVGKGVTPNTGLVKDTEVKINEGIVANPHLQTSVPNIYAAGDVCEYLDVTTGAYVVNALWPIAVEEGRVAGLNMAGENIEYDGSLGMNSIEFFGLPIISLGVYRLEDSHKVGAEEIIKKDLKANCYEKLILKDNRLLGAVLVGRINNSGLFLRLIREKVDISEIKGRLLSDNFNYGDIVNLVKERERIYV